MMAGVKHWHGAAKDSWMSHVAFEACGVVAANEWCEPVSNEEYAQLPYGLGLTARGDSLK